MMNAGLGAIAPNANPMAAQPQPFQQLLALNEAVKAANLARAAQGQQAMAQAQQQPPTVKDQLMGALNQALGASNYGFAGGGIVAFTNGGSTNPLDILEKLGREEEEARNAARAADERLRYYGPKQRFSDPQGYQQAASAAAAAEARLEEVRRRINAAPRLMSPASRSAGTPQLQSIASTQREPLRIQERNFAPLVQLGSIFPPAGAVASAGPTPPAGAGGAGAGAPRLSPAAGAAAGPGAGAPAGAGPGPGPAAGQIDLSGLSEAQKALAELVGQRGAVSPAVVAAREEYDRMSRTALDPAEQQLRRLEEQQRRSVFSDPEAMAAMLMNLRGDMTIGEALAAAGAGAAKTRASREARVRDARDKLAQLRSDLALTQARERMARAEGDDRAVRDYRIKEAEIKAQIQATLVDMQFKQEKLGLERRQVGAQERQARAAEISAGTRAAGADDRGEAAKRKAISDAIEAAQKAVPIPAGVTGPARQRMIDRQVEMVTQQVAPYGVTRDEVLRYFATPGPASGATTPNGRWGQVEEVSKP
jgi:hypothetical protein